MSGALADLTAGLPQAVYDGLPDAFSMRLDFFGNPKPAAIIMTVLSSMPLLRPLKVRVILGECKTGDVL